MPNSSRLVRIALPAGLFGFAFAVRALPWPRVLSPERVHLVGTDAYYHLRRVLYTLENFPAALTFDPYIGFPAGGQPIWPATFDWLLALLALPFYGGGDAETALTVERMLVWVPPLLGAGTVVTLYLVTRQLFGRAEAVLAGATLSVLSAHYWYSQVGFVDHHAAVSLLSTLLLFAALAWLRQRVAASRAAAVGALMAGLLLVWPGGLLHVAIIEVSWLALWLFAPTRQAAIRDARGAAVANTVACVLVLPAGLASDWTTWSAFSPVVLSHFQAWLFGTLAVLAAAAVGLWSRPGAGETRGRRLAAASGIGLGLLALSVFLFPELIAGAGDALQWLLKEEAFQAAVAESQPLFVVGDALGVRVAEARLSRFLYLAPLAATVLVLRTRREAQREGVWLLIFQLLALGAVTVLQKRFFNTFSVALALVMGWSLVAAYRELATRFERRAIPAAAVTLAAAGLLWPVLDAYRLPTRNVRQALAGEPIALPPALLRQRAFERAARWLRDHSPDPGGFFGGEPPTYGVLALWTHGHMIEYVARRPSVADNFGDDLGGEGFYASHRYFMAPEGEANAMLEALRVRYVLVRTATGPDLEILPPQSMWRRLSSHPESLDLNRLRLVYDRPMPERDGTHIRIFEYTPPR